MLPKFLNMFEPGTITHYERGGKESRSVISIVSEVGPHERRLTLVVHEASAELLECSSVAHGPERTVELIIGYYQVLGVTCHVDDLEC